QSVELSMDTVSGCHYSWLPWNFITPEILIDTTLTGGPGSFTVKGNTISNLNCISTDSVRIVFRTCTGVEKADQPAVTVRPNPFKTNTEITILAEDGTMSAQVVDQKGVQVKKITEGKYSKGLYTFVWDGKNDTGDRVAPGNYLVVVSTAEKHYTCKLILNP
ncbi:MAG: FlgD immunoglobulin-like domain containing protein, partial [Syntrophothermus sp.]